MCWLFVALFVSSMPSCFSSFPISRKFPLRFFRRSGRRSKMNRVLVTFFLFASLGLGETSVANPDCDAFPPQHTLCTFPKGTPGRKCTEHGPQVRTDRRLSDFERRNFLTEHNGKRSIVAKGWTNLPPASDMRNVEWDESLERVAQRWADQCTFDHDCYFSSSCRNTDGDRWTGQNVFTSRTWHADPSRIRFDFAADAVNAWFGKIRFTRRKHLEFFPFYSDRIGHFTQIVHSATHRIGCGVSIFPAAGRRQYGRELFGRSVIVICNYAPGGNLVGGKTYTFGDPASECPNGTIPDFHRGLCI